MGIHFDSLVEFVKAGKGKENRPGFFKDGNKIIPDIQAYLEKIVRKTKLFEFPLNSEEILPRSGKEKEEYRLYIANYFDISHQYRRSLIMPFTLTGIEDKDSVTILDYIKGDKHRVIRSRQDSSYNGIEDLTILVGDVHLTKPDRHGRIPLGTSPLYVYGSVFREGYFKDPACHNATVEVGAIDLVQDAIAYIEQTAYIMDPANFIIERESNASLKQTEKEKKGVSILRKTINRPHFICLSAEDTRAFLLEESLEPYPAHPVIGHYKTLISDRYVNMKGQRIFIGQYWTGEGEIIGRHGWNYRVFIKVSPTKVIPYIEAKENKR